MEGKRKKTTPSTRAILATSKGGKIGLKQQHRISRKRDQLQEGGGDRKRKE